MLVDTTAWSGEGAFTQIVLDHLKQIAEIDALRIEDAPASRSDADYNFVSNEIFVKFATTTKHEAVRRFGFIPGTRAVEEKGMAIPGLEAALTLVAEIGAPDYSDQSMMQYLRTERIVPPYQTRGYKLVELVRIYEMEQSAAVRPK
jgi:hypothetical protein